MSIRSQGGYRDIYVFVGTELEQAPVERVKHADLVIGVSGRTGHVLKDRYGRQRIVRDQDPCPCGGGLSFPNCHGLAA